MELAPHARYWPFIGSTRTSEKQREPSRTTSRCRSSFEPAGEAGPYPAFLGSQFSPRFTSFHGKANRKITKTLAPERRISTSRMSATRTHTSRSAAKGLTLDVNTPPSLLDQMEDAARRDKITHDPFRGLAYSLIGSEGAAGGRRASRRSASYGHMLFGQIIAARRLVKQVRGSSRVLGQFGRPVGHRTRTGTLPAEGRGLMPGFIRGFSGLIADLDQRRMLDETGARSERARPHAELTRRAAVAITGQAYSVLLAGGGVPRPGDWQNRLDQRHGRRPP